MVSTALGAVSLTENLRAKTLELGNKIADRKAYSVARVERLKDSWFCYCCLLIWVAQLPQKKERKKTVAGAIYERDPGKPEGP